MNAETPAHQFLFKTKHRQVICQRNPSGITHVITMRCCTPQHRRMPFIYAPPAVNLKVKIIIRCTPTTADPQQPIANEPAPTVCAAAASDGSCCAMLCTLPTAPCLETLAHGMLGCKHLRTRSRVTHPIINSCITSPTPLWFSHPHPCCRADLCWPAARHHCP